MLVSNLLLINLISLCQSVKTRIAFDVVIRLSFASGVIATRCFDHSNISPAFFFEPSIFLTTSQRKVYFHCVHLVGMFACFDILLDLFFSIVKSSFQYKSVTENKNNY